MRSQAGASCLTRQGKSHTDVSLQVVTKRTKNLKKQDIPSLDDPISKLNHIGKETVKKLNELMASADEAQLDIDLPEELHK